MDRNTQDGRASTSHFDPATHTNYWRYNKAGHFINSLTSKNVASDLQEKKRQCLEEEEKKILKTLDKASEDDLKDKKGQCLKEEEKKILKRLDEASEDDRKESKKQCLVK